MFPSCLIQSIISELYSGLCKDVEQSESSNGFAHFKENLFAVNKEENSLQLKGLKLGPHACIALTKQLAKSNLSYLDLSANNIGDCVENVLQLARMTGLKSLNLASNGIGDKGMIEIAKFVSNTRTLQSLNLSSIKNMKPNTLSLECATLLSDALCKNRSLTFLNLSGVFCESNSSSIYTQFTTMIGYNTTLKGVKFDNNGITNINAFLDAAALQPLSYISVANNKVSSISPSNIPLDYITQLDLSCNSLTSLSLSNIVPRLNRISKLELQNNEIKDEGAIFLSKIIVQLKDLKFLNVSNNKFTSEGGVALAFSLSNSSLEYLDLAKNALKDETALAFSQALSSDARLKCLNLSHCQIADPGAIEILSRGCSLNLLNLSNNFITRTGGLKLSELVSRNLYLKELDLNGNSVDFSVISRISDALNRNLAAVSSVPVDILKGQLNELVSEKERIERVEEENEVVLVKIAEMKTKIENVLKEKKKLQDREGFKRLELKTQLDAELTLLENTKQKLENRKIEVLNSEAEHQEKLKSLVATLDSEVKARVALESDIKTVQELVKTVLTEREEKGALLKSQITKQRQDKTDLQKQLARIKKDFAKLKSDFSTGKPVMPLLEEARNSLSL